MLIDPDKIGFSLMKIFAVEFFVLAILLLVIVFI
jgi:hypothetical protein